MSRQYMRGVTAIAAAVMLQAAMADQDDDPVFMPPRILQRPDNFDSCHAQVIGDLGTEDEPSVNLTIAEDGTLKKYSLPDSSPEWMKELSRCALGQLRFSPGTSQGRAAEHVASLAIKFRARGPEQAADISIERVGPLITPPRIRRRNAEINRCFPADIARRGKLSRFVVTLTVQTDGTATSLILPVGTEAWHEEIAHCLLAAIDFIPGTRDGMAVSAQATLPIMLTNDLGGITAPELRSTNEVLEAAYRACYPPDLLTLTSAYYSFDIASNGKVSNPKVVKGTGNPRLDEAGACILKRLEFTPSMQDGRAIRSRVTWELPMRPPR